MKKLLLLTASLVFSAGAWADCSNPKGSLETQKCLNLEVGQLKHELHDVLKSASESTNAQKELGSTEHRV